MKPERDTFPWSAMMAVGFGRLRLSSRDFWGMTPRELAAAVEGAFGVADAPPDRAMLERLMGRYPDRTPP
ncbi:rcc01693 family protein [Bauldia litoralis]|uniref:rcc01693 family protein n=1 Tax=Bauldia litoralis TaxID=665467 RepID=UPI00244EBAF6|nr:rcc01693 family protein [Bauldia litoralis]